MKGERYTQIEREREREREREEGLKGREVKKECSHVPPKHLK